jgi:hypothetical protein
MNTKIKAVAAIACGVVACGVAQSAHANLVADGGFTDSPGQLGTGGSTTAPSWFTGNGVQVSYNDCYDWIFNGSNPAPGGPGNGSVALYGPLPASAGGTGGTFLGIDPVYTKNGGGTPANSGINSISQTISGLQPGATYTLSFYWAAAQQQGYSGNTFEGWNFGLGNTANSVSTTLPGGSTPGTGNFGGWQLETITVTATSTSELLKFVAEGGPGSGNPPFDLLDGVTLTQNTVPDSSSTAGLMGLGVVAMGIAAGCRRFVRA